MSLQENHVLPFVEMKWLPTYVIHLREKFKNKNRIAESFFGRRWQAFFRHDPSAMREEFLHDPAAWVRG